jgi:hypothetical protein
MSRDILGADEDPGRFLLEGPNVCAPISDREDVVVEPRQDQLVPMGTSQQTVKAKDRT